MVEPVWELPVALLTAVDAAPLIRSPNWAFDAVGMQNATAAARATLRIFLFMLSNKLSFVSNTIL